VSELSLHYAFMAGVIFGAFMTAFIMRGALRDLERKLARKIDTIGCGD